MDVQPRRFPQEYKKRCQEIYYRIYIIDDFSYILPALRYVTLRYVTLCYVYIVVSMNDTPLLLLP